MNDYWLISGRVSSVIACCDVEIFIGNTFETQQTNPIHAAKKSQLTFAFITIRPIYCFGRQISKRWFTGNIVKFIPVPLYILTPTVPVNNSV